MQHFHRLLLALAVLIIAVAVLLGAIVFARTHGVCSGFDVEFVNGHASIDGCPDETPPPETGDGDTDV